MKLARVQRPQTKNNLHVLVAKETDKQFIGLEVLFDSYADGYNYIAVDKPVFGENTESVNIPTYVNKFHCTNYTVADIEKSEFDKDALEAFEEVKRKIEEVE